MVFIVLALEPERFITPGELQKAEDLFESFSIYRSPSLLSLEVAPT